MKRKEVLVVAGFPGTGKTMATKLLKDTGYIVADLDSSEFSKEGFPFNYIDRLVEYLQANVYDVIFISTHVDVRNEMDYRNLRYTTVFPARSLKAEYMDRYIKRGSPDNFLKLVDDNWNGWMNQFERDLNGQKITLHHSDQYLYGVIRQLMKK